MLMASVNVKYDRRWLLPMGRAAGRWDARPPRTSANRIMAMATTAGTIATT